jgi:UDP-glucose 4-epimerase
MFSVGLLTAEAFGAMRVTAMHALILGGTGFTGQALIRHLRGDGPPVEVSVVARTATSLTGVGSVLTGHYGDLARTAEFRRWLERVDAVVHLADGLAVLQQPRLSADVAHAESLIAASVRLAGAARAARVPLLVYVSSIKALCDEHDDRVLVETSAPRSTSAYGQAKLRLEQVMGKALAGSDTRLVIVRNPVMYAPGKTGSIERFLRLADTPLPLPLGRLSNRRSLLSVRNLASALGAIVRAGPDGPAGAFHVHDGPALSTTEIVATLRAALGRPRRLFAPGAAAAALAMRTPLVAPAARRLYGSLEMSDAHFRRTFDWTPVAETQTALAEMAAAYAAERGSDAIRATALRRS